MSHYPPNRDNALKILAPGKKYLWKGEEWEGLIWLDDFPDNDQPTEQQVIDLTKSYDDSDLFDLKYAEIRKSFENSLNQGFDVSLGFKVDSKLSDLTLLSVAYSKGKLKNKTEIRISDFDNNIQTLTISEFEILLSELGDFTDAAFEKKWALRKQIYDGSINELTSIKW